MKIRIGNDICARVTIQLQGYDVVNIQSIKACIINKTKKAEIENDWKNKSRFIGRFPIEPFTDEYLPTAYDINSSGYPQYFATVPHRYNGFGVYPDWTHLFPKAELNVTEYMAQVRRTNDPNIIDVLFPASAQLYTGEYKIILVLGVYSPGYNQNNIRTISVDYNNAFELVSSTEDADAGSSAIITIDGINDPSFWDSPEDIYTNSGEYQSGYLNLNLTNGNKVNVDMSSIDKWYEGD